MFNSLRVGWHATSAAMTLMIITMQRIYKSNCCLKANSVLTIGVNCCSDTMCHYLNKYQIYSTGTIYWLYFFTFHGLRTEEYLLKCHTSRINDQIPIIPIRYFLKCLLVSTVIASSCRKKHHESNGHQLQTLA